MRFADKDYGYYSKIFTMPFVLLVVWSLIGLVAGMINPNYLVAGPFKYGTWFVIIIVFGWTGWSAVRNFHATMAQAAWTGALLGLLSGFAGAVVGLITYLMVPGLVEAIWKQLTPEQTKQLTRETMDKGMLVFSIFWLILGPIFYAVIGAALAAIGAVIGRNAKKETPTPMGG